MIFVQNWNERSKRYELNIFTLISLFGGLAMFLYGMRLMGDSLKEGSSGTLKLAMEKFTSNAFKAFLLGLAVTALIQSSTATIVITSGLVGAGIITLRQSLGIIIGANVGTTVTGQIIRLLDLNTTSASWLQLFKPATLAPVALIIGIILIMAFKFKSSDRIGNICIGFGILFSGLLNMTGAVGSLSESGIFETIFSKLEESPLISYLSGAGVAFALQSSSATIGILQAFSTTGLLTFKSIYTAIVGIYLGDCVTTAIVCSIGAKAEARRVGIVHILFNLSETIVVLIGVSVARSLGLLDGFWELPITSGGIANTNTVFNLSCAVLLFPMIPVYEKLSHILVKDDAVPVNPYQGKLEALNPVFYKTPALAFQVSFDILCTMFDASRSNFNRAVALLKNFDDAEFQKLKQEEEYIDQMTDRVSGYLVNFSAYIREDQHARMLDQFYRVTSEFERLGDHSVNISETAENLADNEVSFSNIAMSELNIIKDLLDHILDKAEKAFKECDLVSAEHIEPLEEVTDDIINSVRVSHLDRLYCGKCNFLVSNDFQNLLSDLERISDICSNIGIATVARVKPELGVLSHDYISSLHQGNDETYNMEYSTAHDLYFSLLENVRRKEENAEPAS